MRIAQIEKQGDRLRQQRPEEVGEDEILREAAFRALGLRRGRNEPVDHSDKVIPDQHGTPSPDDFVEWKLAQAALMNWFRQRVSQLTRL